MRLVLRASVVSIAAAILAGSCGGDGTDPGSGGAGSGGASACAKGALVGADGACHAIGVQGCARDFVDADGLCRPTIAKCDKGMIPNFSTGCVAVGIPKCASRFVGADGLCHVEASACAAGELALPEKGCVAVGTDAACGPAPWGTLPSGAIVYVDPTFDGEEMGTADAPYQTLGAAVDDAPEGALIALAAGEYHESISIERAVTVHGRCPSMVKIVGLGGMNHPNTIEVDAGPTTITGVTVSGDGIGVSAFAPTTVDGVIIDGAEEAGVNSVTTHVTVRRALITATRPRDGGLGVGLLGTEGGAFDVSDSVLLKNHHAGVSANGKGAVVKLDDVLVAGTVPLDGAADGIGITASPGAKVVLRGVALVGNHVSGLLSDGVGARIEATNIVVEGGLAVDAAGPLGAGLEVGEGSSAKVTGGAFLDNLGVAVLGDTAASLTLETTLVQGTRPIAGVFGRGLEIQGGVDATITDSAFVANGEIGVVALEADTKLTLDSSLIEDTRSNADGTFGVGVFIDTGPHLVLKSSVVSRAHVAGAVIATASAEVSSSLFTDILSGTIILQSSPKPIRDVGDGVLTMLGGTGTQVAATRVERCARAGALFEGGSGAITVSSIEDNRFGLVLEGDASISKDDATSLAGNSERATVEDGTLPVPNKPAPLPE